MCETERFSNPIVIKILYKIGDDKKYWLMEKLKLFFAELNFGDPKTP
jgi:hypothetical protein